MNKSDYVGWAKNLSLWIVITFVGAGIIRGTANLVFSLALQTTGYQILFNKDLLTFFLTPQAIASSMVIIVLASMAAYLEFSVVILLARTMKLRQPIHLKTVLRQAISTFSSLKNVGLLGCFVYLLLFLPISRLGLISSVFSQLQIPNFITGELAKMAWGPQLVFLLYTGITIVYFLLLYTLPMMVLEGWPFFTAAKRSCKYIWSNRRRLVIFFALYLAVWVLLYWGPKELFLRVLLSNVVTFEAVFQMYRVSWSTLGFGLVWLLYLIGQVVMTPLLLSLMVLFYEPQRETVAVASIDEKLVKQVSDYKQRLMGVTTRTMLLLGVPVLLIGSWSLVETFRRGADLHEPIVIGHRGSIAGVENSLEAIQGAVAAGADYAEIDILLSADGVPMVIHDDSLKRLANRKEAVHQLTAEELKKVTLTQNGMTGSISTLEEVILATQGKIQLAVELKLHGHETKNLVDEVATVLTKYQLLEEVIFLSLDYQLVDEMNTKHPETTSGYCIFGSIGYLNPSVIRTMNIDFVFIEEWMATQENLLEFRRAWLPVYVWTVNQKESMDHLLQMGVLGLVTDYPEWGTDAVAAFGQNTSRTYLDEADWKE